MLTPTKKIVRTTGYEFNEALARKIKYAYYDDNTESTISLFGDMMDNEVQREWEMFNGEFMIGLRWALAAGDIYKTSTNSLNLEAFKKVPINRIYKAYPINTTLTIMTIIVRVSEDFVLSYGLDTVTGSASYCLVNLTDKTLISGVGQNCLAEVLSPLYSGNFLSNLLGHLSGTTP